MKDLPVDRADIQRDHNTHWNKVDEKSKREARKGKKPTNEILAEKAYNERKGERLFALRSKVMNL